MKIRFSTILFLGLASASTASIAQQGTANPATPPSPAASPAPAAPPAANPGQAPAQEPTSSTTSVSSDPTAPGAGNIVPDTYVIGPDDQIQVNVWKEPTLSGTVPVRPDGMISLALIGETVAAGRTPIQLAADLTAKLKKFVTDPTVTVSVLNVNSKKIYLLGEIAHVGPLPLTTTMSPLQAISAAGGLTPYANKSKIYILRIEQGKQKKIPFDYKKALKDGNMQGVTLVPGDTVVVP